MISENIKGLLDQTIVWDNHVCMPLRPGDEDFLPQLTRFRESGVSVVSLNIHFDLMPLESAFTMLATFRHWIAWHSDKYRLVETLDDIEAAKANHQLAIVFDLEGGKAVEAHLGLVEIFYRLGVRWMLIAYNKNNKLGGGCLDEDTGLTDYGRQIIDEMERVGMVLCCSHTGYRTAKEAIEYANNPVIFSHSNPWGVYKHNRNIPDDLMLACAHSGGVININGVGIFLGDNDNTTETVLRHIDYAVQLTGPDHVGLGLDYACDITEIEGFVQANPTMFPADLIPSSGGYSQVEPERISEIAEGLIKMGYSDAHVQGILGHNNLRVARQVWK